ncbi:hypothetical protein POV27_07995 [Aureisphaera galaxeae]|uniref:hypothetical protein n=1 Tax=Aureisphaera galaxeae TaxID=1538023 RepID=UPI00235065C3|nr:hypothetical protein [Aureisphaera galaxeae]MDC8003990.1 hypothetical protein [Aureisphaera galaxeae]
MNLFQKAARKIIKISFDFAVKVITFFSEMSTYHSKLEALNKLPEGTLGAEIANCLRSRKLHFVPGFESHDLKHILLDYEMTPEEEIRLQAFMIGNGNHSIPSYLIFVFGALLLPDRWRTFYEDYIHGKRTLPISHWTLDACGHRNLEELRKEIVLPSKETLDVVYKPSSFIKIGALGAITAGISGMLFCLPFLFSSNMADLVGAGFPFIGGAILVAGGLISWSNTTKPQKVKLKV